MSDACRNPADRADGAPRGASRPHGPLHVPARWWKTSRTGLARSSRLSVAMCRRSRAIGSGANRRCCGISDSIGAGRILVKNESSSVIEEPRSSMAPLAGELWGRATSAWAYFPQHLFNLRPLPQGQGSCRPLDAVPAPGLRPESSIFNSGSSTIHVSAGVQGRLSAWESSPGR